MLLFQEVRGIPAIAKKPQADYFLWDISIENKPQAYYFL